MFGKGVGFKYMPYDITPTDEVQRIFFDVSRGMAGTLAGLSDNVLLAASDIVDLAKMELECKLNPNLVVALADHIQFAIERRREGIDVQNSLQKGPRTFFRTVPATPSRAPRVTAGSSSIPATS